MAVLISIMVLFYSAWWGMVIHYFVKMPKLSDVDKKLKLTGYSLLSVMLEQILALVAEWVYLTATLKDIHLSVPEWAAVVSAALIGVGAIASGCFYFLYIRKQFPESCKKGKVEKKYRGLDVFSLIAAGLAVSLMNFWFNTFAAGAFAHFIL